MINNDTVVTSTIFGISAGIMTEQWVTIVVGAIVVGVIQPFFRIFWTKLLLVPKKKVEKMAYGKKRKTKKKKDDKKKKRRKRR